ncbi:MAG: hypothetical protein WAK23_11445, partial [Terriglobales bacterium]
LHFVSKSVETLSFFQIRASSNRARSFFSAAAYASLPSKSRNGQPDAVETGYKKYSFYFLS